MTNCATGLDRLFDDFPARFRGARAGLIANPASVDARLIHAADRLAACSDLRLTALFGPQHGARADLQDNMIETGHAVDARLGVPVYSLYGEHRQPTAEMLAGIDVLFCDLTDVGCRAYTYLWTMLLAMEACATAGKTFCVLDRPNPIGGLAVEGHVLETAFTSFIGMHPLPMRHGMTLGELAALFRAERHIHVDLEVIAAKGWTRDRWADQTGLAWVMPSPNMPSLDTATVYPGSVLVEGTNLSEGRGTTRPFEIVGAPYLDPYRFAEVLNARRMEGVWFRPLWFMPAFDKWRGESCGGVQIHVLRRERFRPYLAGLALLRAAIDLGGEKFAWRQPPFEYEYAKLPVDILAGTDQVRQRLLAAGEPEAIEGETGEFRTIREEYLLY